MNSIGLYFHVPFCRGKCPYCDFYSVRCTDGMMDDYTDRMIGQIQYESKKIGRPADTLYFGGGTPSLLGGRRIRRLAEAARAGFGLENAEITVEANPDSVSPGFFREIRAAGVNRLSLGLQSANGAELKLLGRTHTAEQAERAVRDAQEAGFGSISLDLMLAIQLQTEDSLRRSVEFCAECGVQHVSAYLLKVERGTPYDRRRDKLRLPGEDETAELYLLACRELEQYGFAQYEISNFARKGKESRHNLKYWRCEEYLGLGPSAHSFLEGKRFHFERGMAGFLRGDPAVPDGSGGDFDEFAMLRMRLAEGLTDEACRARFGFPVPERLKRAARRYETAGLTHCAGNGFCFTPKGFLLSDALTPEILFAR